MGFPGGKHAKCFRHGICHFSLQRYIFCKLSIMGDQPDENTKEFSKEELNVWNVEKLRKYLKDRGIVITSDTRKGDLISKVYYASRLHLQLCSTKEQEEAEILARRKGKLLMDGISLPFPEDLANWSSGSQYFPDTTMTDIETYLFENNDRKSMKEGKSLYESGHVSDVEYNNISECVKFCYVRGKVVPQTRIGENPVQCMGLPRYWKWGYTYR